MIEENQIPDVFQQFMLNPNGVNDVVDVEKHRYAIGKIEEDIEQLKEDKKRFVEFFDAKIRSKLDTVDFLSDRILNFLKNTGRKNVSVPDGTIFITNRIYKTWPDNDVLLKFCKEFHIPIRIKEEPSKTDIAKFIEETSQTPPGYEEEPVESLSFRSVKNA